MKAQMKVCMFAAMLALPVSAFAEGDTSPKSPAGVNCPMMGDMQKNVGTMMKDMSSMMGKTSDPSMKAQMQKMHDQMRAMMGNMQKMGTDMMGGEMMGGGMMQGGPKSDDKPTTPASPTEEDHKAHHPDQ